MPVTFVTPVADPFLTGASTSCSVGEGQHRSRQPLELGRPVVDREGRQDDELREPALDEPLALCSQRVIAGGNQLAWIQPGPTTLDDLGEPSVEATVARVDDQRAPVLGIHLPAG